jgi:hypothetical protein
MIWGTFVPQFQSIQGWIVVAFRVRALAAAFEAFRAISRRRVDVRFLARF